MMSNLVVLNRLFLKSNYNIELNGEEVPICKIRKWSKGMQANAYFFGHPLYSEKYLRVENYSKAFGERWKAAVGSWDNKVVIDIGCGPGNLFSAVGGSPKIIIGIDISYRALKIAHQLGYIPILADAQELPFLDGCADIVTLNAALHHCDDMTKVLTEAARLVKPNGLLITDEDPQCTAWNHKGLGLLVNQLRKQFPMYWLPGRSAFYRTKKERALRLATELHNCIPGDGIQPNFFYKTLEPLGFSVNVYPHNHNVGAELFNGDYGRSPWRYTLAQRLSGMDPNSLEAAQSVMCIAKKNERK